MALNNIKKRKNITFKSISPELYYRALALKGKLHCRDWQTFLEKVCKIVEDELDAQR